MIDLKPRNASSKNALIVIPRLGTVAPLIIIDLFLTGARPKDGANDQPAAEVDASQHRLDKVLDLIEKCSYGIHDICSAAIDANTRLPSFNMPLEPLDAVTGATTADDILNRIFSTFCIGK